MNDGDTKTFDMTITDPTALLIQDRDEWKRRALVAEAKLGIGGGEIDVEGVISDSGATLCRAGDELRVRFQRANHAIACLDYWSRGAVLEVT